MQESFWLPAKRKTPFLQKEFITRDVSRSDGCGLVDHGGRRGQLLIGVGRVGGDCGIKLADGSAHTALYDTIPQVFLFADLHALFHGLDIRQLGSPPLRILKKPSHGIISCLV